MRVVVKGWIFLFVIMVLHLVTAATLANAQPVVETTATGQAGSATTTHAITMPSGIVRGDLLLAIVSFDVGFPRDKLGDLSFTSGWQVASYNGYVSTVASVVLWRIAAGGDSLSITSGFSRSSSHVAYRISNAIGLAARSANGNSANSDPPAYDTGMGARDVLWIAARSGDAQVVPSASPSGYGSLVGVQGSSSAGVSTHAASRTTSSASEDPGVFTVASEQWVTHTIAVFEDVEAITQARAGGTFATGAPGSVSWSNPSNAATLNGSYATTSLDGEISQTLSATNFSFSVPATAVINGVTAYYHRFYDDSSGYGVDESVRLIKGGSLTGSNYAIDSDSWPSVLEATSYGYPGDLWGTTLSPSDVNASNFGIGIQADEQDGFGSETFRIDYVELRVTYLIERTTRTVYIDCSQGSNGDGSSGSPYNSTANWQTGEAKNLPDNAEIHRVLFKGSTACAGITVSSGAGWASSDTHRIIFTTEEADRHEGVWSTSKPRIEATGGTWGVEADGIHMSVIGMQVKFTTDFFTRGGINFNMSAAGSWIARGNIVQIDIDGSVNDVSGIGTGESTTGTAYISNNIIYGADSTGDGSFGIKIFQNAKAYVYHNTIVGNDNGIRFDGLNGPQVAYNNILDGNLVAYANAGALADDDVNADYNIISNASQTNAGANDVLSADVVFVSGTDFLLDEMSDNSDTAVNNNLYADSFIPMVDDILGQPRPSTSYVTAGAHEIPITPPTPTNSVLYLLLKE